MNFDRFQIYCLLGALTFAPSAHLIAQRGDVSFKRYSIEDGLSNATVTAVAQDSTGIMWFGTEDGLNRFDGYAFTTYRHIIGDSASIVSGDIRAAVCDRSGRLWIATASGLDQYDRTRDRFVHFRNFAADKYSHTPAPLTSLMLDRGDTLWIGSLGGGLLCFDMKSGVTSEFRHEPANPHTIVSDSIRSLYAAHGGRIWVSFYTSGISIYERASNTFSNFITEVPDAQEPSQAQITSMCEDREGKIWFASSTDGLFRFDDSLRQLLHYGHDPEDPQTSSDVSALALATDARGNFWIGTSSAGIDRFNFSDNSFSHYPSSPRDVSTPGSNRILVLSVDRTGSLWAGTWRGGISVYHPYRQKFSRIYSIPGSANGLSDNSVRAICDDDSGNVWIGTETGGLNRYTPETDSIIFFRHEITGKGSLSSNHVSALLYARNGNLWVGTDNGLDLFDRARSQFMHHLHISGDSTTLSSSEITAIFEEETGVLWVGCADGTLNRYIPGSVAFAHVDVQAGAPGTRSAVTSIREDRRGHLWIGTRQSGLIRYDGSTHEPRHYAHNELDPYSLASPEINFIELDDEGNVWLGTSGGGLQKYDAEHDRFAHYSTADGLPDNTVTGIVPDRHGKLWLGTANGLSRFDPATGTFRNYGVEDGAQATEFFPGSCLRGRKGKIFFGGIDGLNVFFSDSVRDNPIIPRVMITSITVGGKPVSREESPSGADEVVLTSNDAFLTFEFIALEYTSPGKNTYAYKMEGADKDWVVCGTRRNATYAQLDGGDYTFRVRGANNDGTWDYTGDSILVRVNHPLLGQMWIRFLALGLLAGVPLLFYRYRFRRLLVLERTRNRVVHELHDEVSATLSGINYFSEAIRNGINQHDVSRTVKYLTLIRESANTAQDSISDILWSVNPDNDGWDHLFAKFREFASELLEGKSIRHAIDIPAKVAIRPFPPDMRRKFWLLYKEMLTSLVRLSSCKTVAVRLVLGKDRRLTLTIAGDGNRFDASIPAQESALLNIKTRVDELHCLFEADEPAEGGTTWKVSFPPS